MKKVRQPVSRDEQVSEYIAHLRETTQLSLKLLDEAYQVLVAPSEGTLEGPVAEERPDGKREETRLRTTIPRRPSSG